MIETLASLLKAAGHELPPRHERMGGIPMNAITPGTEAFTSLTLGTPTYTGRAVNPNTALSLGAVWACTKIISEAVASLPLLTYRNVTPDGLTKRLAVEDYRYRLLREAPNPEMTSFQWREFGAASLCGWGNWYNYLDVDSRGRIKAIWPLRPDWVVTLRNATGKLEYRYYPLFPFCVPVEAGVYQDWQVMHVPGLGWDGIMGYSPVGMLRQAIALGLAHEEYAGRFYAGGGQQKVAITAPQVVKDPEALRTEWNKAYSGLENTGRVAVLQGGLDVKTFGVNPKDAQFIEARAFQVGEIARIFKVPPFMLGDPSGKTATYASAEQADIQFVKHCIIPWCKRIEEKINTTILGTQDALTCRHDVSELLRGDSLSQQQTTCGYVTAGVMTRDEARARLDLNPKGGTAGELTVQSQNVPLDDISDLEPAPQSQAPTTRSNQDGSCNQ